MNDLFLIEVLKSCFRDEIANNIIFRKKSIILECQNGEQIQISTKKISSSLYQSNLLNNDNYINTQNTYVYNHNYFINENTINKLLLRTLNDCKDYINDACNVNLNALIKNEKVIFKNNVVFQIIFKNIAKKPA